MESKVTMPENDLRLKYPCLMIRKATGCVVMFIKEDTGMTLHVGGQIGTFLGELSSVWIMDNFEPAPKGTIVRIDV